MWSVVGEQCAKNMPNAAGCASTQLRCRRCADHDERPLPQAFSMVRSAQGSSAPDSIFCQQRNSANEIVPELSGSRSRRACSMGVFQSGLDALSSAYMASNSALSMVPELSLS